jgi:hypothetical protein
MKLYFKDFFDVYAERKFLQKTNNNMQLKKMLKKKERLTMTNIAVTKISLQQHILNIMLVRTFLLAHRYSLRKLINFHFTILKNFYLLFLITHF